MGAPRQMFFHFLKFYFTIPLFFCSLDYPSSFLNMIPSESEPKAHWWLAHPRVYVAQNRFWHLLTISDPRRLYIYISDSFHLISVRKCSRHCQCCCFCACCRDEWRTLENLPCSPGRWAKLRHGSCVLCLVTSCHIWQGRERLRYLLFYILTRPPFLLIMNLPLGRNEDSEYLPHSMLTVLSFSSLWTCPLPAKATLWHS